MNYEFLADNESPLTHFTHNLLVEQDAICAGLRCDGFDRLVQQTIENDYPGAWRREVDKELRQDGEVATKGVKVAAAFDAHRAMLNEAWRFANGDISRPEFDRALATAIAASSELGPLLKPAVLDEGKQDEKPTTQKGGEDSKPEASLDARALGVFIEHPTWTKVEIAKHLRANPKSLAPKRCPKLAAAINAHKAPDLPKGQKSADGTLEAEDDSWQERIDAWKG